MHRCTHVTIDDTANEKRDRSYVLNKRVRIFCFIFMRENRLIFRDVLAMTMNALRLSEWLWRRRGNGPEQSKMPTKALLHCKLANDRQLLDSDRALIGT